MLEKQSALQYESGFRLHQSLLKGFYILMGFTLVHQASNDLPLNFLLDENAW